MSKAKIKPIPSLSKKYIERFWKYVDKREPDACWPWIGHSTELGYGLLSISTDKTDFTFRASRVSYFLATGVDPGENFILHRCDYPPCVNPGHLFPGTPADNMADKKSKGRSATGERSGRRTKPETTARGERQGSAKLTDRDVRVIRGLSADGITFTCLARKYGVEWTTIRNAVVGKTWKHVV